MAETEEPELVGGWLALDVANSVDHRERAEPEDHLRSYADLIEWLERAGALAPAAAGALRERATAAVPAGAELGRARTLRETVFRVFRSRATGQVVAPEDLALIQATYGEALAHGRLDEDEAGFRWTWDQGDIRLPRWLIARSAVDLLLSDRIDRLKACASEDGCQYLFLDTSKNGSRRWCSMATCGNLAKSRRLTANRRAERQR